MDGILGASFPPRAGGGDDYIRVICSLLSQALTIAVPARAALAFYDIRYVRATCCTRARRDRRRFSSFGLELLRHFAASSSLRTSEASASPISFSVAASR